MIPLARFNMPHAQGQFGAVRKYDVHTGIDLYCNPKSHCFAIEEGTIIAKGIFTGPVVDTPWWNETNYVVVKGKSGDILYGEIDTNLSPNTLVKEGQYLGEVLTVLREKKEKPMTMLHIELYEDFKSPLVWNLNEPQPAGLVDPTFLLARCLHEYYDKNHKSQAEVVLPEGDWFNISGRGRVMTVNLLKLDPSIRVSVGDTAIINDRKYLVRGIEYPGRGVQTFAGLLLTEVVEE